MDVLVDLTRRTTRLWYSTVQVAIVDLLTQSEMYVCERASELERVPSLALSCYNE